MCILVVINGGICLIRGFVYFPWGYFCRYLCYQTTASFHVVDILHATLQVLVFRIKPLEGGYVLNGINI